MLRLPTISGLQRAATCEASVTLDQLEERPQGAAAKRGAVLHRAIIGDVCGWLPVDTGRYKVNYDRDALRDRLGLEGKRYGELAFSYTGDAIEVLGQDIGRDYNRPGTLCGAADIVVVRPHALVVDIKTGTYPVPQPAENWQLAALASFTAWAFDQCVTVTGIVATLARDGSWDFGRPCEWSVADLELVANRIDDRWQRWREAAQLADAGFDVERTPSRECFFCPCKCEHSGLYQRSQKEAA